jgi:hypothetical protein
MRHRRVRLVAYLAQTPWSGSEGPDPPPAVRSLQQHTVSTTSNLEKSHVREQVAHCRPEDMGTCNQDRHTEWRCRRAAAGKRLACTRRMLQLTHTCVSEPRIGMLLNSTYLVVHLVAQPGLGSGSQPGQPSELLARVPPRVGLLPRTRNLQA